MKGAKNWTVREKWKYLKDYLNAYTKVISNNFSKFTYIDAFAGKGDYGGKKGSPLIALDLEYLFTDYIFIEINNKNIEKLKHSTEKFFAKEAEISRKYQKGKKVKISMEFFHGEAKDFINQILDDLPQKPCFIFLDPDGLELDMDTVIKCSKKEKVELLINFSVMGVVRNISKTECQKSLTKVYGSEEWKDVAVKAVDRGELYAQLYLKSLEKYFKYSIHKIIKNNNNSPLYYLIFVTNNEVGHKIMKSVMCVNDKQSFLGKF